MLANIIRNAKKTAIGGGGGGIVIDNGDPYYSAVSLLLPMDGTNGSTTFTDSGPNALAVTAVGNAQISTTQSQFGGASAYFDGSGDYLTFPTSTALQFGSGDFTVEMWVYKTSNKAYMAFAGNLSTGTNATMWQIISDSTGNKITWFSSGFVITGATTLNVNTWYHVAVSRNGTNLRLFINGILDGSATNSHNYSSTNQVFLAQVPELLSARDFAGFIDDLRISLFARYVSNFTPPIAALPTTASSTPADPYYGYTSLLLHMDGTSGSTNFVDSGPSALAVTAAGNTQVSTTQSKYGGASAYFDGAGDYVSATSGNQFQFGTGDFTIEMWVWASSNTGQYKCLFSNRGVDASSIFLGIDPSAKLLYYRGAFLITDSVALNLNQWYHVALVRKGSTITLYKNGVSAGSVTDATNLTGNTCFVAQESSLASTYFNGFIDDLRITKYARTITAAPTAAFPNS